MSQKYDLTTGNVKRTMMQFVFPYLLSCFMQTFYGMADLFVVGLYNGPETSTAVSIGSQVTHMLTVIIVGLAMGVTVRIGRAVGARDKTDAANIVGSSTVFFAVFGLILTLVLVVLVNPITMVMMTPKEAVRETQTYLVICFFGIPFITAYNVISSIFRGVGDSRRPMYFVAIACVINVMLDFIFIGGFHLGAAGAALGTVIGQAVSVIVSLFIMRRQNFGFQIRKKDIHISRESLYAVLKVGIPVAMQDGLIQVAFVIITIIANSRGLIFSNAVGIVEKLISFMFLVPSAFLSAISAATAQNMGAGKPERARECLRFGLLVTVVWGIFCFIYNQFLPHTLVGLFTQNTSVLSAGSVYLRAYSLDCIFAALHFCFSGYFCGDQKSEISFIHNILSVILIRVPGAYLASRLWPESLYPMGLAAPLGSLLSVCICVVFYVYQAKSHKKEDIKAVENETI